MLNKTYYTGIHIQVNKDTYVYAYNRISRATILQAFPELKRIRKFAIEYLQDGQWKACYQGEDPGERLEAKFEPVTAQRVRLNLLDAHGGPTIWEFQLFK